MRSELSNSAGLRRNRAGLRIGAHFLASILFLCIIKVSHADVTEWEYKLATEHPNLEVKCTQVLWNKCLTWNWRNKDDNSFRRIPAQWRDSQPVEEDQFEGFQQNDMGFINIPAVAFAVNTPGIQPDDATLSPQEWIINEEVWMLSHPERGVSFGLNVQDAPKLGYKIRIKDSGTWYLWIKGEGPDASSDSVNYGINGVRTGILNFRNQPWSNDRQNSDERAHFDLQPGDYDLNIWQREDGTRIMIIVLTQDPNHVPTDADFSSLDNIL